MRNLVARLLVLLFLRPCAARRGGSGGGGGGSSAKYFFGDECSISRLEAYPWPTNVSSTNVTTGDTYRRIYVGGGIAATEVTPMPGTINYESASQQGTNWGFDIYDVYYNGTFTMTLEPPAANATACPKLTSGNLTRQYLRIGAPKGPKNLTRTPYDSNPFYFSFGSSDNDDSRCPYRPNKAYVGLTSSNDDYEHSQPWKLRAEKHDDAFELSGYVSQHEASRGNYFTYTVNKTSGGVAGAGADANYPRFCIDEFSTTTLTARDAVRMSARVDAAGAVLTWSFIAARSGYNVSGEFRGAWWDKGARLVTNGGVVATEGEAERVWPSRPEGFLDRWGKWLVVGIAVLVLLVLVWIVWRCCWRGKARKGPEVSKGGYGYGNENG